MMMPLTAHALSCGASALPFVAHWTFGAIMCPSYAQSAPYLLAEHVTHLASFFICEHEAACEPPGVEDWARLPCVGVEVLAQWALIFDGHLVPP